MLGADRINLNLCSITELNTPMHVFAKCAASNTTGTMAMMGDVTGSATRSVRTLTGVKEESGGRGDEFA